MDARLQNSQNKQENVETKILYRIKRVFLKKASFKASKKLS